MSMSGFTAPGWFALLVLVAALVGGYIWTQRARRKRTLRFANLELLDKIAVRRTQRWRHVPPVLLVGSLLLLTTAMAGPTAEQKVPRNRATVVLAIDVSLSMKATDVDPNRLQAAQDAAKDFVADLTPGVNLGLVSFAGTATVLVSPTTDREGVIRAIDNLTLAESTATGEAIYSSLQVIEGFSAIVTDSDGRPPPARIVLMADGGQNVPTTDLEGDRGAFTAAGVAAEQEIPISSISFGTEHGTVDIDGQSAPVPVDDFAMRHIADISGGEFYKAATVEQLKGVYDDLAEQIGYEIRRADASRPWAIAGTLVLVVAAGSSLLVSQRLP